MVGLKSDVMSDDADQLCSKIACLVQERGWNQEEFARLANLNRLTIRNIFLSCRRRLHNATVSACARVLGLSVNELRTLPLESLTERMNGRGADFEAALPSDRFETGPTKTQSCQRGFEEATQPELMVWIEQNPDRASRLSQEEMDELLSLQGTGGPMTADGVTHFVELIERKRRLMEQAAAVAGTEYIDLLEQFIRVLYEKIQPYAGRGK